MAVNTTECLKISEPAWKWLKMAWMASHGDVNYNDDDVDDDDVEEFNGIAL